MKIGCNELTVSNRRLFIKKSAIWTWASIWTGPVIQRPLIEKTQYVIEHVSYQLCNVYRMLALL